MRYISHATRHIYSSFASNGSNLLLDTNRHQTQFIAPTTPNAWKEHVRGLEAMISNYGSAAFDQAPMRQVFEQARMHMVRHLWPQYF
jgi:hypothetical protein